MDKILLMLQLQNQLNDATNGEDWTKGLTKNAKIINWKRCIYMECAEMVDSFSWKHWKAIDKEPDWANHQIEVVDVWHFIMSLVLEDYKINMIGDIGFLAKKIEKLESYKLFIQNKDINPNQPRTLKSIAHGNINIISTSNNRNNNANK